MKMPALDGTSIACEGMQAAQTLHESTQLCACVGTLYLFSGCPRPQRGLQVVSVL